MVVEILHWCAVRISYSSYISDCVIGYARPNHILLFIIHRFELGHRSIGLVDVWWIQAVQRPLVRIKIYLAGVAQVIKAANEAFWRCWAVVDPNMFGQRPL